jgi:hypothetical protein
VKKPTPPKVTVPKCRTVEECERISSTLKDAYSKGRRFRKVGFDRKGEVKS